jgi:hypothetical protein
MVTSTRKRKYSIAVFLISLLALSLVGVYLIQLKVPNTVIVWVSDARCSGGDTINPILLLAFAKIKTSNTGEVAFTGDGISEDVIVRNVTTLSMSEGIYLWANDSLNAYPYPVITDADQYFIDKLYATVSNLTVKVQTNYSSPQTVPHFNIHPITDPPKSYSYVNLDEVESMLDIEGNESYKLSVSADVVFSVTFPKNMMGASVPGKIVDKQTVDFGSITVSCVDGVRQMAHLDFPYRVFSFQVETPYLQTIFH